MPITIRLTALCALALALVAAPSVAQAAATGKHAAKTHSSAKKAQPSGKHAGNGKKAAPASGGVFAAAARYLGLTPAELRDQLPGTSLGQLAEDQGKSVDKLQAAMMAAFKARLDSARKQKLITKKGEKQVLALFHDHISALVALVWPEAQREESQADDGTQSDDSTATDDGTQGDDGTQSDDSTATDDSTQADDDTQADDSTATDDSTRAEDGTQTDDGAQTQADDEQSTSMDEDALAAA